MEGSTLVNDGGPPPVKVLYVAAAGRSGSTILGNILGELDGIFHAGELRTLWRLGLKRGRLCGCGQPVRGCTFWASVVDRTFGGGEASSEDTDEVERLHERAVRLRYLPRMLRLPAGEAPRSEPLRSYTRVAERLYPAIANVSGSRVIVDSSKGPADAAVLRSLAGVEPYFLQLVRDPRAVAYSWRRQKESPGSPRERMMRLSPATSTKNWLMVNLATEAIRRREPSSRSIVVRYESFVTEPRETIQEILRLIGEDQQELPFVDDHHVRLTPGHTAGGNPDRFRTGSVELREDAEWLERQPRNDRSIATLISFPLLGRYGYRIFPERDP